MKRQNKALFMLMPSLAGFAAFAAIPFLGALYYAFVDNAFNKEFVGFGNFIELFQNRYFLLAIKNTLVFSLVAVPCQIALSVALAMLTVKYCQRLGFVKLLFFMPFLLPSASAVAFLQSALPEIPPYFTLLILFLWKYSGLCIMLIITALLAINPNIIDTAKIDGAGSIRLTFSVVLPCITPTLFFVLILSIVNSLKIYRESFLLYGSHPDTSVYMLQNYLNNHFERLNYQNISTAAIVFAVCVYLVVAFIYRKQQKRSDELC